MRKIIPFLWFDQNAEEAINFYVSIFGNSKILNVSRYDDASSKAAEMPEGLVMSIDFELEGQSFGALNGGPMFKFNPAMSFFVNCESKEEVDRLWSKLSDGGEVMMELGKYPYSDWYGWIQDKYGVSWQLFQGRQSQQKIVPALMFSGDLKGRAEEAVQFYTSLFKNSSVSIMARYEEGDMGGRAGAIKHANFYVDGYNMIAMDNFMEQANYSFAQGVSLMINCRDQAEVDFFWEKLSEGGQTSQCGWTMDKYGIPWQVVPTILGELLNDPDPVKAKRVMEAMLKMTKIEIEDLKKAYDGV